MVANGLTDGDVVPDLDGVTYGARRDELLTRRDRLVWKYADLLPELAALEEGGGSGG